MIKFETTCLIEEGIHARPASELVKLCQTAKSDIKISKNSTVVNPKSILGLMSLGISLNDILEVEVSGEDEEVIASSIESFFKST